jgi:hypothetical protein
MKIVNILSWTEAPVGCMQSYCPKFRDMTTDSIIHSLNIEIEWIPYGYDLFFVCKSNSTVFISKSQ